MKHGETIPFVIGHRGACGHAPENTLPSIERAAGLGARWIEIDVKLSADGVPFLMHDDRLERTTDGDGLVSDLAWAALSRLDAGSWFDPAFEGTQLLSLEEAIGHIDAMGLGLNVELKPCPGREDETAEIACRVLADAWPASLPKPIISSFDAATLMGVRTHLPDAALAMLFDEVPDNWAEVCQGLGTNVAHIWHEVIAENSLRAMLDAGFTVRSFTVNQRTRAAELLDMGLVGVFTDFPERMTGF